MEGSGISSKLHIIVIFINTKPWEVLGDRFIDEPGVPNLPGELGCVVAWYPAGNELSFPPLEKENHIQYCLWKGARRVIRRCSNYIDAIRFPQVKRIRLKIACRIVSQSYQKHRLAMFQLERTHVCRFAPWKPSWLLRTLFCLRPKNQDLITLILVLRFKSLGIRIWILYTKVHPYRSGKAISAVSEVFAITLCCRPGVDYGHRYHTTTRF